MAGVVCVHRIMLCCNSKALKILDTHMAGVDFILASDLSVCSTIQ